MEKKVNFSLGMLIGLALAALIIMLGVWGWQFIVKSALPPYTSTAPQPSAQPADLPELTSRVATLENDLAYTLRDIAWKMDQKLVIFGWAALLISFVAGFVGIKTYSDLDKVIKKRVNKSLEEALYQLDPTNLPIHIYKGRIRRTGEKAEGEKPRSAARDTLSKVKDRLKMTGLLNVGEITYLDKTSLTGITVIPIDDEKDEAEFIRFVEPPEEKLKADNAGFILYSPPGYTIKTAMDAFPNTVIANMPATVASMVLVVGRGLKNREK